MRFLILQNRDAPSWSCLDKTFGFMGMYSGQKYTGKRGSWTGKETRRGIDGIRKGDEDLGEGQHDRDSFSMTFVAALVVIVVGP